MKKLSVLFVFLLGLTLLFGCNRTSDPNVIKVVATRVPHAEILEVAKPILAEKGYTLEIEVVSNNGYNIPNPAVARYSADANFFQHVPYFDNYNESVKEKRRLVNAGAVHIEPIGLYSKTYKSISDIKDGDKILMSNSVSDKGRLLKLLEKAGLIVLKEGVGINATLDDIVTKNVNITIDDRPNAEKLVQALNANEAPVVLINSNYALEGGLNPIEDAFYMESAIDNPYANIVAVRKDSIDLPKIKALMEVLTSDAIKNFIITEYKGSVVPV